MRKTQNPSALISSVLCSLSVPFCPAAFGRNDLEKFSPQRNGSLISFLSEKIHVLMFCWLSILPVAGNDVDRGGRTNGVQTIWRGILSRIKSYLDIVRHSET